MGQAKMKKRFPNEWSGFDDRAMFANSVCRLIYQKNKGDIESCLLEVKEIYDYFQEHVRNVYEVISSQIPLFYLYDLKRHGADNWDWEGDATEAFNIEVEMAINACHEYYD